MDGPGSAAADEQAFSNLRSSPRDSMFLIATMRRAGGAESVIKVRNLSAGGLMAEVETGFSPGEAIEAELRGIGNVSGRIAWAAGGRVGVAFDQIVDPKLARKPVSGGPQPHLFKPVPVSSRRPGLR